MKYGTIEIDGEAREVLNAYSCGPGETPHSFDVPGGHAYEFGGVWKYSPRIGHERAAKVDASGYRAPSAQA